jgi:hypothetical protein
MKRPDTCTLLISGKGSHDFSLPGKMAGKNCREPVLCRIVSFLQMTIGEIFFSLITGFYTTGDNDPRW